MMQSAKFALFLGDLSMTCHEADLEEAFSPYGTILEIRVKRSKETAKTLSYGFLEFDSANAAVTAMNEMDGKVLKGRPLRIRWAASKRNPVRKRDIREDLSDRISMHVKFMSYKIDKVITEEVVRNIFSVYGDVCDTTIKQVSIDRKTHRLKGYGFVSYFNDEAGCAAAQRALHELHETTLDDVTYKCELSTILDAPAAPSHYIPQGGVGRYVNAHQGGMNNVPLGELPYDVVHQQQSSYYDDYGGGHMTVNGNGSGYADDSAYSAQRSFDSGFDRASIVPSSPGGGGGLQTYSTGSSRFISSNSSIDPDASPKNTAQDARALTAALLDEDINNIYAFPLHQSGSAGVPSVASPPQQRGVNVGYHSANAHQAAHTSGVSTQSTMLSSHARVPNPSSRPGLYQHQNSYPPVGQRYAASAASGGNNSRVWNPPHDDSYGLQQQQQHHHQQLQQQYYLDQVPVLRSAQSDGRETRAGNMSLMQQHQQQLQQQQYWQGGNAQHQNPNKPLNQYQRFQQQQQQQHQQQQQQQQHHHHRYSPGSNQYGGEHGSYSESNHNNSQLYGSRCNVRSPYNNTPSQAHRSYANHHHPQQQQHLQQMNEPQSSELQAAQLKLLSLQYAQRDPSPSIPGNSAGGPNNPNNRTLYRDNGAFDGLVYAKGSLVGPNSVLLEGFNQQIKSQDHDQVSGGLNHQYLSQHGHTELTGYGGAISLQSQASVSTIGENFPHKQLSRSGSSTTSGGSAFGQSTLQPPPPPTTTTFDVTPPSANASMKCLSGVASNSIDLGDDPANWFPTSFDLPLL